MGFMESHGYGLLNWDIRVYYSISKQDNKNIINKKNKRKKEI
jgi:hypothetical protein